MSRDPRLGPPPVDPMPDVAWSRIERGLWARLDGAPPAPAPRPPRRWLRIAVPAALAAAAVVAVLALRGGDSGGGGAPDVAVEEPSRIVAGAAPSSITFADS